MINSIIIEKKSQILSRVKQGLISPEDWTILKESLPQDYSLKPGTLLKAQLKFFTSILDGTLNKRYKEVL